LYFLDRFDVLMSKIIFKKWKNISGMYFGTKNYLKSTHNHIVKHALTCIILVILEKKLRFCHTRHIVGTFWIKKNRKIDLSSKLEILKINTASRNS
jgi:hypothetical protein